MKDVLIEYGDTHMRIEVPDTAIVVRDGETHREPAPLPDPVEATRQALRNPLGTKPIRELVNSRSKVVIVFPDRVKGGFHPTAHRRVTIPLIMEELAAAGVPEENVTLICAIGLHRKNRREEFVEYLGRDIAGPVPPSQLINHDPEDPDGMVDLGETAHGDVVDFNRLAFEADLTILLGHTQGNPYGGYSGGYKMPCTGLTGWRSIRCHHTPSTMYRDDFVPVSTSSYFRNQLRTIGKTIERGRRQGLFPGGSGAERLRAANRRVRRAHPRRGGGGQLARGDEPHPRGHSGGTGRRARRRHAPQLPLRPRHGIEPDPHAAGDGVVHHPGRGGPAA